MGRTNVEQKLKREIGEKNQHSRLLRRKLAEVAKYLRLAAAAGGKRWKKRYAKTAARVGAGAEGLRECVLKWDAELEKKIREEMKISEAEVQEFQRTYEKELAEYKAAHEKAKASKKTAKVSTEDWELAQHASQKALEGARKAHQDAIAAAAKAASSETKEKKDAEKALQEVESEKRDKALFTLELDRIVAERHTFKK